VAFFVPISETDDKMYLLQAGRAENIVNSVGTLTEGQTIILCIFILLVIPTTVLSIYFFVKKLNIRKFGPVERLEEQQKQFFDEQQRRNEVRNRSMSDQHFMDEENKENDEHLKERCQERTINMRLFFQNELAAIIDDPLTVSAICVHFRATFSNAIIKNHFTKELVPERYAKYRERILNELRAEYVNLALRSNNRIPDVDIVLPIMENFLNSWLYMIKDELCTTCQEKINVYERYKPRFNETPDLKEIVDWCIKKNQDYIRYFSI
jgi:hypothetical protein